MTVKSKKKLIEVALPLQLINEASIREKSIRHGHPSTLHLWWARRPLAAARAVIFAQMVDDPSANPDLFPTEKDQEKERQRLFRIIEELVKWESTTNEEVLEKARNEIWQSWRRACAENVDHPRARELFDRNKLPAFHDPFAGGGALPLEAQRLGLVSYASDLNPVAVLINKAMIEIPPKFAGMPPINPITQKDKELFQRKWTNSQGLAEDVRYYGGRMRNEAEKRIGNMYMKVEVTAEISKQRKDLKPLIGQKLTVIAWLWARTVKSPNPAFANIDVPLITTYMLSTKKGKEAYIEPVIENDGYTFTVKAGKPKDVEAAKNGTKLARGANFQCLMSATPIASDYIKSEGKAGRMGSRLIAIVAESDLGRVYLPPVLDHEIAAHKIKPDWKPDTPLAPDPRALWTPPYGLTTYGDLFTSRQLVALATFSGLVTEICKSARQDALTAGMKDDVTPLNQGGHGATAYADAIAVYLAFAIDRMANTLCTIARWTPERQQTVTVFSRQAIPMTWDYPEVNPFAEAAGDYGVSIDGVIKGIPNIGKPAGFANQADASTQEISRDKIVSTDPPYYDNIGYADLSDFFYVWLRRSLQKVFPDLFATLAVPKIEELVAIPYRHGNKEKAESFFLNGMTNAMHRLADKTHPEFPVTIYYAFKQSETESKEGISSTGWETFLDAVIRSGFDITGTWPMRTELSNRMIGAGTNALASSIVLVCRKPIVNAPQATRREFVTALKRELPEAMRHLQAGNIAPVDLSQAAIGPGMSVYTRYSKVVDAEGELLAVREALALINQTLDDALAEQEGDFDAESRWAVAWFEQQGFSDGDFGIAETLSKAKNTSVKSLVDLGLLASKRGKVRLLKPDELSHEWDPTTEKHVTSWQIAHQMIRVLENGGENAAAELLKKLGKKAETARELSYRLYTLCERKKRTTEALAYNGLVQSWPEIARLSGEERTQIGEQASLFNQ